MFLLSQAWISLVCLPEPKAKRKTVLKVRSFKEASLRGCKRAFVSWCRTRERFQDKMPLGSVSTETIQDSNEIFVLADING